MSTIFIRPGHNAMNAVPPADEKRAGDQGLVAADGGVEADLEVGPPEFVLDLLVTLLDPVPDAVDPDDL
ncbi:hypothetical protein OH781_36530 [Streptomyces sp. NBC_01550]|uniref:hypothetical protein n=1 Tax=Streptomyces sp. NBC_01550 TaxID=2975875 RepID=UPI002E27D67A|nr:hypothetical protein [Streptomyces sp. NBC_00208]